MGRFHTSTWSAMLGALLASLWVLPLTGEAQTRCAVLEVFLRGDAEKSAEARSFVEKTYGKRPGLLIAYRDVAAKELELERYYKLADHFKVTNPGLPAFYVSGRFEFGWDAATTPIRLDELLTVEVFVRQGCPRCAAAKPVIFQQLAPRYPGYRFVEQDLVTSVPAQQRLQVVSQRHRTGATSVPALHFCDRLMIGFYDAATSFRQWDDVLKAVTVDCPPPTTSQVPTEPARGLSQTTGQPVLIASRTRESPPRTTRLPVLSVGWFGSLAMAGETAAALPQEAPPPEAIPPVIPAETVPPAAASASDAPPPRPARALPPEVSAEPSPILVEPPSPASDSGVVTLPVFGDVNWKVMGLPAFTVLVGLVDGFNPCAMWVLMFLLSMLVNLQDRWKILAVAGTFVVISGLAYFAFMAAWLNVFQLIGLLRPAQIALGVLGITVGAIHIKDFFAFKKGISLSIPESAKPALYARIRRIVLADSLLGAVVGASVLAVLVNIVELLCTAGLPAMYTGVLTLQDFPVWKNYAYLALYIAAYMFDDSLMVAIVVYTMGKHRLQEQGGRILKLISGLVILAVGVAMLVKPEWLV